MNSFIISCEQFQDYPKNLVRPAALKRNLKAYHERLNSEKHKLFCDQILHSPRQPDFDNAVDFMDINGDQDPHIARVTDLISLKLHLRPALRPGKSDPLCRFIFIHARHSRAPLRIAREMFKLILSYHQIPPSFLDFVFTFGQQINARDSYFSGLRDESRIDSLSHGLQVPELMRTGRELRLCYNLRSVETSWSDPHLPWSIRQCAVYHSFDLETGKSVWITIKGNELIKQRVEEEDSLPSISEANSLSESFASMLEVHLLLCDWSTENWHLYINNLEDEVRSLAPGAIAIPVEKPRTPPPTQLLRSPRMSSFPSTVQSPISSRSRSGTSLFWLPSRSTTVMTDSTMILPTAEMNAYDHDGRTVLTNTNILRKSLTSLYSTIGKAKNVKGNHNSFHSPKQSPVAEKGPTVSGSGVEPPERPPNFSENDGNTSHATFDFKDLQHAEYLEEKLHDSLLHLHLNVNVLEELRHFYQSTASHREFPADVKSNCATHLAHFDRCILGATKDLRMLQSRIETLLQLLINRKHLLNCILQHKSTKANESFSKKAHESAQFMKDITVEMHSIAKKTERETVSMRAITSVTLFFLPATFLASFMSTGILDFKDGKQDLQLAGLKMYLAIALPATFLTFIAWYVIYRVAKNSGDRAPEAMEHDERGSGAV